LWNKNLFGWHFFVSLTLTLLLFVELDVLVKGWLSGGGSFGSSWSGGGSSWSSGCVLSWVLWGNVSGGSNLLAWCGLINSGFLSGAWGTGWSILWSVGSTAGLSNAVNSVWSVVSMAYWERTGSLDDDWGPGLLGLPLGVVVLVTLHDDVCLEIFITVHSVGEEFDISWSA
jgi:hypothetical protein